MNINWEINQNDIEKVNNFIKKHKNNPNVLHRIKRNINKKNIEFNKSKFWQTMVSCLLTTQQKSNPNSPISKFIREKPFLLNLEICLKQKKLNNFVEKILSNYGGIRFSTKLGKEISKNLQLLNNSNWNLYLEIENYLKIKEDEFIERTIADMIDNSLIGFGPKQSRNLLQTLGISKYEIPIDSRLIKWLNNFGFPLKLSANALSDTNYYNFIMDGIKILCKRVSIFPCVFDAIIFSSYDGDDWNNNNLIF
jgi:hypothetical protein